MNNAAYPIVFKRANVRVLSCILLLVAAVFVLASCATSDPWLNSDRIERRFGSYGVDVLENANGRRISSLYSNSDGGKVTRTYAVVDFPGEAREQYAREHASIEAGGSIGATFRDAGWQLGKQHLYIGQFEIPSTYTDIGELMQIELPETLATHVYVLRVSKNGRSFSYATIAEIHHPDYLQIADLKEIYGEVIFDDSNRDSIHDFIGPPNPRK